MRSERSAEAANRETTLAFREAVANAVSVIRTQEAHRSYVSLSIEELVDRRLAQLLDSDDQLRLSRRAQVQKVYDDMVGQLDAMKETNPSDFERMSQDDNANTDPDAG